MARLHKIKYILIDKSKKKCDRNYAKCYYCKHYLSENSRYGEYFLNGKKILAHTDCFLYRTRTLIQFGRPV